MRHAIPTLLLLFCVGCSGPKPLQLPAGPDATVSGTVEDVDREPMAVDSDAVITLRTSTGEVEVFIPARINLCEAEGLNLLAGVVEGSSIEVRGQTLAGGGIRPCESDEHYLRVLGS